MSLRKALESIALGLEGRKAYFPAGIPMLGAPTDWQIAQVAIGQRQHAGKSIEAGCYCSTCLASWFVRAGPTPIPGPEDW